MSINGEKVRFALKRALESMNPKFSKACIVRSVSANPTTGLMTCDCESIQDKTVLEDVRLVADFKNTATTTGFVLVPKVGSIVLVSFLADSECYVSMVSDVDTIFLNGNNYEGIVKAFDLTIKLNALENNLNNILMALKGITVSIGSGGGAVPFAPFFSAINNISPITNKADIENATVKHGNGNLIV